MRRERAVGGVEHVMALVEHQPRRQHGVVVAAERRLDHDQRMVGDHDLRALGAPDRALDEAAVIVLAGRVDALAAAVRQAGGARPPDQLGQPAGKVAARQVAVARRRGPARHQAERDGIGRRRRHRRHGLLEIEQAQIVFAALAHHDPHAVDLVLQVARVGRDPHGPVILLGPQARRREIAQRLADAGAGFREHDGGAVLACPRRERRRQGGGVVGLARPRFGVGAQQVGEPAPRLILLDRRVAGGRRRRVLGNLRQAAPRLKAARTRRHARQRGLDEASPRPARGRHRAGDRGRLGIARLGERTQQGSGDARQRQGFGRASGRALEPDRVGEAARGRHAELRRPREREQLEHVEAAQARQIQPPRQGARVADQRRRACDAPSRRRRLELLELAVGRQEQGQARARHHGRCVGQQDARRGFWERHRPSPDIPARADLHAQVGTRLRFGTCEPRFAPTARRANRTYRG